MSRNGPSAWGNANRNGPPAFGNPPSFHTYIASLLEMADSRPDSATTSPAIRGEEMSMHKTPLTELERDNYILAAEVRRLREENERLRKDAEWMNGDIADLRQLIARCRERELTMGWNQE